MAGVRQGGFDETISAIRQTRQQREKA